MRCTRYCTNMTLFPFACGSAVYLRLIENYSCDFSLLFFYIDFLFLVLMVVENATVQEAIVVRNSPSITLYPLILTPRLNLSGALLNMSVGSVRM